jgi:hypothetical protein
LEKQLAVLHYVQKARRHKYGDDADEWPAGHTPPEIRQRYIDEQLQAEEIQDNQAPSALQLSAKLQCSLPQSDQISSQEPGRKAVIRVFDMTVAEDFGDSLLSCVKSHQKKEGPEINLGAERMNKERVPTMSKLRKRTSCRKIISSNPNLSYPTCQQRKRGRVPRNIHVK